MNMRNMSKKVLAGAALSIMALSGASFEAQAKDAGDLLVRGRIIAVIPDDDASISPIGGNSDLGDEYTGEVDFSYFFTPYIAAELILATTKHGVAAVNTDLGDVDLGHVWLLPPTLTLQFHPLPDEVFSPYVGAGINYTVFYNSDPGALADADYDNSFGWALQAGVDIAIGEGAYVNVDVKKLWLNTDASFDAGTLGTVNADVDIDPWILGIGIGKSF